jgi:putative OPT family oligopeptide transporter
MPKRSEGPRELTLRALVLGAALGIAFAASSVYLGLKVGLTVSASIPIAVLSITLFRALGRSSIHENNIVQTTGSAGESIAAGVAFTVPSLLLMGFELEVAKTTWIALLGGLLGILMMVPLRRGLIVRERERLPYPEGTACAQVLLAGERGGVSARTVFAGLGAGGLFGLLGGLGRFFGDVASWSLGRALPGATFAVETNAALLGVGYVVGTRVALVMLAGGLLSYWVLIPAIHLFGPELTSPLIGGGAVAVRDMAAGQVRNAFLLYVGAGAVATGGLVTLVRSLPTIAHAFREGLSAVDASDAARERTDRDLPMRLVLGGAAALTVAIALAPGLGVDAPTAVLVVLFGFFFVTVSSRITGEIGSSSNPISGMTVATLLATCLLFAAAGRVGVPFKEMALSTAALVCVAAANGGTTSQDLKTGYLIGATPRAQQLAILVGAATSAVAIGWIIVALDRAATTYVPADFPDFRADAARVAAAPPDALAFGAAPVHFRGADWRVLLVRAPQDGVPVGRYLVGADDRIAHRIDPGVCGTEPEQRAPDGTVEKVVTKFDAPKAQLFRLIIDGVLGGELPWGLVLLGVAIAVVMELCGVASLPFAVGVYIPLATTSVIALGGLVRHAALRGTPGDAADADAAPGTLFASGLVAGGALAGLAVALLQGLEVETIGPDGVARPVSLVAHYGLALAPRLLGEETAKALAANATWTLVPLLLLAAALGWVAARGSRTREASRG